MTLLTAALWIALSLVPAQAPAVTPGCDASPLLIRRVNVWTRDGALANRDVVVRDGRIDAIAAGGTQTADGLRTLDGVGHTLLPGLVDTHLHFTVPGGLSNADGPRTDTADITGRQLLRSGVTSGRLHLAGIEEAARLKARSLQPCAPLPRLQVGGPGLSGAAQRDHPAFQGARDVADARQKIERIGQAGLDWLAVHNADRFPPEVLTAIAESARRAGLRLMAAGTTPEEIEAALRLNPDTLDYFDRTAAPRYGDALLAAIRAQRTLILAPTPGVPWRTATYLANPGLLDRAASFDLLTAPDRAFVQASARKDLAAANTTESEQLMRTMPAKLAQLRGLGLPIAVASDAGSTLHLHPDAIWWELEAWRGLGVPHRDALIAATEGGARVLKSTEVGRLAVGARADFILYRGDAETGAFDVERVRAVGKDGVLFVHDGRWAAAPPR